MITIFVEANDHVDEEVEVGKQTTSSRKILKNVADSNYPTTVIYILSTVKLPKFSTSTNVTVIIPTEFLIYYMMKI